MWLALIDMRTLFILAHKIINCDNYTVIKYNNILVILILVNVRIVNLSWSCCVALCCVCVRVCVLAADCSGLICIL